MTQSGSSALNVWAGTNRNRRGVQPHNAHSLTSEQDAEMPRPCEFRGCIYRGVPTRRADDGKWYCDRHWWILGMDERRPKRVPPKKERKKSNPQPVRRGDLDLWLQLKSEGLTFQDIAVATGHGRQTISNTINGLRDFSMSELEEASRRIEGGEKREHVAASFRTTRHYLVYALKEEGLPVRRAPFKVKPRSER